MITKEEMQKIHDKHTEAKKDFKNRCLLLIEVLTGGDIGYTDIEKLKSDIYRIAHVGSQTCSNDHQDWVAETEKMFSYFEEEGFI